MHVSGDTFTIVVLFHQPQQNFARLFFSFPNTTQGELKFFDNYIIPLAKKLRDCNVFGVSSDECLNYAVSTFPPLFFSLSVHCLPLALIYTLIYLFVNN